MAEHLHSKQYTQDQLDCLQEICNVATGETADVLARRLNAFVTLPIPLIQIIDTTRLPASIKCFKSESRVYAASQRFFWSSEGEAKIHGLALVLILEQSVNSHSGVTSSQTPIIEDISEPMIQACLGVLSNQCAVTLSCEPLQFLGVESLASICISQTKAWRTILMVENHYTLEDHQFEGGLLLLFPEKAIITVAQKLDYLLDC